MPSKSPPPRQVKFPSGLILDTTRVLYAAPQKHLGAQQLLIKFDNGQTLVLTDSEQIREVQGHFGVIIPD